MIDSIQFLTYSILIIIDTIVKDVKDVKDVFVSLYIGNYLVGD